MSPPKYPRAPTPPPIDTASPENLRDGLHRVCQILIQLRSETEGLPAKFEELRELFIELAGRDGKGGAIAHQFEDLTRRHEARGVRVGKLETDNELLEQRVAKLERLKSQLVVLGSLAMLILGAALKSLFNYLF